jgi:hypothetical protein
MHRPTNPWPDRFFARLDRFECECPNCGKLIFSDQDERSLPTRLKTPGMKRGAARQHPYNKAVWKLTWNPFTQRLRCPWCRNSFVAGLLLYPMKLGGPRPVTPPPDTTPTKRQLLELRRRASGWFASADYHRGDEVNLVIDAECICPEHEWAPRCPVHGNPLAEVKIPDPT